MKRRGFIKWFGVVATALAIDPLLGGEALWGQTEVKPKELRYGLVSKNEEDAKRWVDELINYPGHNAWNTLEKIPEMTPEVASEFTRLWKECQANAGPWRYPIIEDAVAPVPPPTEREQQRLRERIRAGVYPYEHLSESSRQKLNEANGAYKVVDPGDADRPWKLERKA